MHTHTHTHTHSLTLTHSLTHSLTGGIEGSDGAVVSLYDDDDVFYFTDQAVSEVLSRHPIPLGFLVPAVFHALFGCSLFVGESCGTPLAVSAPLMMLSQLGHSN